MNCIKKSKEPEGIIYEVDTINPHLFYPNVQFTGATSPDPEPTTMSQLLEENLYDNSEYVFDYELVKYVGKDEFYNWFNSIPLKDQTITNFMEYFNVSVNEYESILNN